ncbi:type II toxin-antitoxin system RelE/ParE family toxin [Botrimarina sp.]|uniref:type II toxin-antitoxin system RelE/ParE family toxin n=1 Tax=Botrimarina sp. TaxID=2795802 RepID=UPI0032EC6863
MSYRVEFIGQAKSDYRRLYSYIAQRSPQGAANWDDALDAALARIRVTPNSFGAAPESRALTRPVRQALFCTRHGRVYRVVFEVKDDRVIVLRLRGPGQRPLRKRDLGES